MTIEKIIVGERWHSGNKPPFHIDYAYFKPN